MDSSRSAHDKDVRGTEGSGLGLEQYSREEVPSRHISKYNTKPLLIYKSGYMALTHITIKKIEKNIF